MAKRSNLIAKSLRKPVKRLVVLSVVLEASEVEQVYRLMADTGLSLDGLVRFWLQSDLAARAGQFPAPESLTPAPLPEGEGAEVTR